jgi:hypothetical protein
LSWCSSCWGWRLVGHGNLGQGALLLPVDRKGSKKNKRIKKKSKKSGLIVVASPLQEIRNKKEETR